MFVSWLVEVTGDSNEEVASVDVLHVCTDKSLCAVGLVLERHDPRLLGKVLILKIVMAVDED